MLKFKTEKITDHITRIYAFSTELMYLVEGEKEAVLIDTGSGFGSLKACVDELTNKPLTVLITHGHVDHAMGAYEFDNVYMSHLDKYVYERHGDIAFRKEGLSMLENGYSATEDDMIATMPFCQYHDLKDGDCFDLGGVSVKIYACPGHTKGSVVILIPEDETLLTGDACNPCTFMFEYYSTSIFEYKKSLCSLIKKINGKYTRILLSHGNGEGYVGMIEDVIAVCDDIMNGTADDIPFEFRGQYGLLAKDTAVYQGKGNIVYNKNNVFPL